MSVYSPKLRDDLIPRLYRLGKALDVPMTALASVLLDLGMTHLEEVLMQSGYVLPADHTGSIVQQNTHQKKGIPNEATKNPQGPRA